LIVSSVAVSGKLDTTNHFDSIGFDINNTLFIEISLVMIKFHRIYNNKTSYKWKKIAGKKNLFEMLCVKIITIFLVVEEK
jgi:hypothetical protein